MTGNEFKGEVELGAKLPVIASAKAGYDEPTLDVTYWDSGECKRKPLNCLNMEKAEGKVDQSKVIKCKLDNELTKSGLKLSVIATRTGSADKMMYSWPLSLKTPRPERSEKVPFMVKIDVYRGSDGSAIEKTGDKVALYTDDESEVKFKASLKDATGYELLKATFSTSSEPCGFSKVYPTDAEQNPPSMKCDSLDNCKIGD